MPGPPTRSSPSRGDAAANEDEAPDSQSQKMRSLVALARSLRATQSSASRRALRARSRDAAAAADGDDPERAMHRQARQHGNSALVPDVSKRSRARGSAAGTAGRGDQEHRLLPQQGEESDRARQGLARATPR